MSRGITLQGTTPPKARGKKISESADSPTRVEAMARQAKPRLPAETESFMRLMTQAFRNEPTRKARKDARVMRGARPNTA